MQNNDIISVFKCAPNLNLDFSMLKSFKKPEKQICVRRHSDSMS